MNNSKRVLSIFGTRPEAVKMAPVIQQLRNTPGIDPFVCVTAQHRQMLDQVLDLFNIDPDYDLNLMQPGQLLSNLTAEIMLHLPSVIEKVNPDWILIQGDTTTVMAAALLGYYSRVKVGHVEAGLRTHDKWQPFPEEINRRIAGVIADLHFAPTSASRENLLREGIKDNQILVTGNTVVDALQEVIRLEPPVEVRDLLTRLKIDPDSKRLVLITAHRRENFGEPLINICRAIRTLAETYKETVHFLYPVHLNPNVQEPVYQMLDGIPNITLIPPMDYLSMIHMMKNAHLILTDSGGIQEEATALRIPTLVLREITERPEGVAAGILKLVGTQSETILKESCLILNNPILHRQMSSAANPFGDGTAAKKIVDALLSFDGI